jgi:DNA repair protein RadD
MLRDYQQRALEQLYEWFQDNAGHPCLVLPTGAGKSHIVAALCKDAVQSWPDTRILMLTHVKELIEQNAEKMRQHWPNAPLGIYSASIGVKRLGYPITFGGIQSLRGKAARIGHVDLVIIDECHLVSHKAEGGYRQLIDDLAAINPALRVIGLTATPYRLGHGLITDKPALFDDLLEPVTIEELVRKGHLATLRSKITQARLDVSGVHKRGGE